MNQNYCLNCNFGVDNKFCPSCGQKTDTHRIVMKHFVMHDLLHGVWHLEKGILFTLKETIIRPGQAALDYIKGKRVRYYNVFYLALLVIGLNILLLHFKETQVEKTVEVLKNEKSTFNDFISKYSKIILFCIVPIFSLNAKLIFKRLKLNIAEHFILAGITLLGLLISSSFLFVFSILDLKFNNFIFSILKVIAVLFIFLFPGWSYFNAAKNLYKTWGFSWRIFCFYLLTMVQFILLLAFITAIILNDVNAPLEINI
jgi:hypothetical protein